MPSLRTVCCSLLALLALSAAATAAELRGVRVETSPHYTDIRLSFDSRPAWTESYRYDPARYVLSFAGTRSTVPKSQLDALAQLPGKLLTKITIAESGGATSVGFYLNVPLHPLVRFEDNDWVVRLYGDSQVSRRHVLAPGATLVEKTVTRNGGGNLSLFLVRLAPGCNAECYAVSADRYDGKTRLRSPSSFARREKADVIVNGGFFGAKGQHLSTLVEEGLVRATGVYPTRPMLVVTETGELLVGRFQVATALNCGGQLVGVAAKNYPFESGKTIVYDHTYPLDTLPQQAMYYYLLDGARLRFHGSDTAGLTLRQGQLLVANDIMPEANPLRGITPEVEVRLETRITDAAGNVVRARSAIGGAPMLVEGGRVSISSQQDNVRDDIARSERSRTAVGIGRDGSLLLAVVKEQEGAGFGGVTLRALAELLIDEGAETALNLDGGGSSALVVAGHSLNLPEEQQRAVSNVLAIRLRY